MKKKLIEKLPMEKRIINKDYEIKITAQKIEDILMMDIYCTNRTLHTEKKDKNNPMYPSYRVCLREKEFATYIPEKKIWSGAFIENLIGRGWRRSQIEADAETIKQLERDTKQEMYGDIISFTDNRQREINRVINSASEKRRYDRNQRQNKGWADPEGLESFTKSVLEENSRYLLVQKKEEEYHGICCICNKKIKFAERPKWNRIMECPKCGEPVRARKNEDGKATRGTEKEIAVFKKTEEGYCIRYFMGCNHLSMKGSEYYYFEKARTFHEAGKIKLFFHKVDFTGKKFWDDKNLAGMQNIVYGRSIIYPEGIKEALEDTEYQYCALSEYVKGVPGRYIKINQYLKTYQSMPYIEAIVKFGLYRLTEDILENSRPKVEQKKTGCKLLGINRQQLKRLISINGGITALSILQNEKKAVRDEDVKMIDRLTNKKDKIEQVLQQTTLRKLCNYTKKDTGYKKEKETIEHYLDYFEMASLLGYDMTKTTRLFPKDLKREHDRMVMETNERELDQKIKMFMEKYKNIETEYKKHHKRMNFTWEDYEIRMARNAKEIMIEGKTLHHCVGKESFLKSSSEGTSIILFIRKKNQRKIPFVTVEVMGDKINQWYGENDKKPTEKKLHMFVKEYKKYIAEQKG